MTAGQPNWQKLHEMGKLPKSQTGHVVALAELEAAEKKLEDLKSKLCENCKLLLEEKPKVEEKGFSSKCEVCEFVAYGKSEATAKNYLRLHSKTHLVK